MTEQEIIRTILQMGVGRTNLGINKESQVISQALEKQIPKKAIDYKCPTCGDEFCTEMWEVDYCCSCGQRLKWSDAE